MFPTFRARSSSRASTTAAGWAMAPVARANSTSGLMPSSRSTHGARSRHALFVLQCVGQVNDVASRLARHCHVLRVKFSSAAKKVKSMFSRCSGSTLWMKVGSSPTASSWPSDSSSSSRRTSWVGKLRSVRTSFSSRPFRVAAPRWLRETVPPQCPPSARTPEGLLGPFFIKRVMPHLAAGRRRPVGRRKTKDSRARTPQRI